MKKLFISIFILLFFSSPLVTYEKPTKRDKINFDQYCREYTLNLTAMLIDHPLKEKIEDKYKRKEDFRLSEEEIESIYEKISSFCEEKFENYSNSHEEKLAPRLVLLADMMKITGEDVNKVLETYPSNIIVYPEYYKPVIKKIMKFSTIAFYLQYPSFHPTNLRMEKLTKKDIKEILRQWNSLVNDADKLRFENNLNLAIENELEENYVFIDFCFDISWMDDEIVDACIEFINNVHLNKALKK